MRAVRFRSVMVVSVLMLCATRAFGQEPGRATPANAGAGSIPEETAPVVIDGRPLFELRGIKAYPAEQRAILVERRIRDLANDDSFDPDTLGMSTRDRDTWIGPADRPVLRLTEEDAETEGIDRGLLAEVYTGKVRAAIVSYRAARTREALTASARRAGVATLIALLPFLLLRWTRRALDRWERRYADRVKAVSIRSYQVVRAERIWDLVRGALRFLLGLLLVVVVFLYAEYVLALFPWTWGTAMQIQSWVIAPLTVMGRGLLGMTPNLVFLTILVVVVRYVLRVVHLFFKAVGRGEVDLKGFEPDWAEPTFNLVRLALLLLTLIVAYPYIPGASSAAFKGVSIFTAAVVSLGSTSFISNIVAGYTMIYRGAFREGDMVKIGSVLGRVTRTRLMVTHLRTPKNEEIIVPNSTILTTEVVNYNSLAKGEGVILHTTVGIGYETPWRQVEAMLLEAAARTPGLRSEPKPFVLQTALGDFAVTYQINVYCGDPSDMFRLYSSLHSNILDLFNEYGVQIMTPAYEGDPAEPKVVPRDQWHLPPASES